jgi:hypothetical protein
MIFWGGVMFIVITLLLAMFGYSLSKVLRFGAAWTGLVTTMIVILFWTTLILNL